MYYSNAGDYAARIANASSTGSGLIILGGPSVGIGTYNLLSLRDGGNNEHLVVKDNGYLGIGIDPATALHVTRTGQGPHVSVGDLREGSLCTLDSTFLIGNNFSVTAGGTFYAINSNSSTHIRNEFSSIKFYTDAGLTAGGNFVPSQRMIINSIGDVGIGTSNPDTKLTIAEGPDTIKIDAIQWGCVAYTVGMFRGGANDPDMVEVGSSTIYQPHFAGAAVLEEVHGSMKVPDDFIDGDTLFMACRAAPSTTGTGNYKFHFWYSIINETGTTTITTPDDSLTATTAASGTAYEFTAIDLGYIEGLDANSCILFRFFRDPGDAADTYGADVCCIGAGYKYRKGSLGQLTK